MGLGVVSINENTYPELFTVDGVNRFSYTKDLVAKTAEVIFPCKVGRQKICFGPTGIDIYIAKWEINDVPIDYNVSNIPHDMTLGAYVQVIDGARPTIQYWNGGDWANGTFVGASLAVDAGRDPETGKLWMTYTIDANLGATPTTFEMKIELAEKKDRLKLSFATPAASGLNRRIRFRVPFVADSADLLDYDSSGSTEPGKARRIIQNILIDFTDAPDKRLIIDKTNLRADIYTPEAGTIGDIDIDPVFSGLDVSSTIVVQNFFGNRFENAEAWPKTHPFVAKWDARTVAGIVSAGDTGGGKLKYTTTSPPFAGWDGAALMDGVPTGDWQNICGYSHNLGSSSFNIRLKFRFEYAWDNNYLGIFWLGERRNGYIGTAT